MMFWKDLSQKNIIPLADRFCTSVWPSWSLFLETIYQLFVYIWDLVPIFQLWPLFRQQLGSFGKFLPSWIYEVQILFLMVPMGEGLIFTKTCHLKANSRPFLTAIAALYRTLFVRRSALSFKGKIGRQLYSYQRQQNSNLVAQLFSSIVRQQYNQIFRYTDCRIVIWSDGQVVRQPYSQIVRQSAGQLVRQSEARQSVRQLVRQLIRKQDKKKKDCQIVSMSTV